MNNLEEIKYSLDLMHEQSKYAANFKVFSKLNSIIAPDGRRPGRAAKAQNKAFCISPNGRLYATLRPPTRANPSTRGFAGGRNVAERSERMRAERGPTSTLLNADLNIN
jgi:hypothetical protein